MVLGDLVLDLHPHQFLGEGLHEEGQQHGPDVGEQLVEGVLRQPQN